MNEARVFILYTDHLEVVRKLESAMNLFGEDPSWCELLVEKCAEITKQEEQIAALNAANKKQAEEIGRLREALVGLLRTYCLPVYPDEIRAQKAAQAALKGEKEAKDERT